MTDSNKEITIDDIINKQLENYPDADVNLIKKAYDEN